MGVVALLASLVLCLVGLTGTANAADGDSNAGAVTGSGSITVNYQHGSTAVSGVELKLYQVATWDKNWNAQATEDFENDDVKLPSLGASETELLKLANTLDAYIAQHQIEPLQPGKTDANGTYTFNKLPDGLYLITYSRYANGNTTCDEGAMLVSLPSRTDLDDTAEGIDITVNPKTECKTTTYPPTPGDDDEDITVNKVWKDDNNADGKRPGKVIVQLIKDGVVVDEVELNESNGWKHTWTDLDKDHTWQVIEKTVPDGYTMSIDREGTTITIVNEYGKDDTCEGDDCEHKENPPVVNPPDNEKHDTTADTGAAVAGVALIAVALLGIGLAVRVAVRRRRS